MLGALALTVAAKAHSVVPTARGGVPNERVVILPGKGEIKSYKAVPEDDQLDSEDVPGPSEVTIGPVATVEEEYSDDEGGSGGYGDRGEGAQFGKEDNAEDSKLPVVSEQDGESDVTTSGPEVSMSGQEDTEMTTKPNKKDSPSSTAYCLVSNKTVLPRCLAESRARCRNLTPTLPFFPFV